MSDMVSAYLRWKYECYELIFEFFDDESIIKMIHMGLIKPCPVSPNPFTFQKVGDK